MGQGYSVSHGPALNICGSDDSIINIKHYSLLVKTYCVYLVTSIVKEGVGRGGANHKYFDS
jgi:hypothetical protein